MNERQLISAMRVLFEVWEGTPYADDILVDVANTIGSRCFGKNAPELRVLVANCKQPPNTVMTTFRRRRPPTLHVVSNEEAT